MISIPSSMAVLARSAKFVKAIMIFTPRIPFVNSLAFRISFFSALMLASTKFVKKSFSQIPIPAAEITPTPPSLATAEARDDREMPIPMPPWIIGSLIVILPIFNPFIF